MEKRILGLGRGQRRKPGGPPAYTERPKTLPSFPFAVDEPFYLDEDEDDFECEIIDLDPLEEVADFVRQMIRNAKFRTKVYYYEDIVSKFKAAAGNDLEEVCEAIGFQSIDAFLDACNIRLTRRPVTAVPISAPATSQQDTGPKTICIDGKQCVRTEELARIMNLSATFLQKVCESRGVVLDTDAVTFDGVLALEKRFIAVLNSNQKTALDALKVKMNPEPPIFD